MPQIRGADSRKQKGKYVKVNYAGIIGGILAFISLALPWWTMSVSSQAMLITVSGSISVYPYKAAASIMGFSFDVPIDLWFGWIALALVIFGGILGIVGSTIYDNKKILAVGGMLTIFSLVIFAGGLQTQLSQGMSGIPGMIGTFSGIGLFSSGFFEFSYMETPITINYSTYLSFGFWLALIAAIIMLAAIKKAEKAVPPPTPMAAPAPPPPPP